MLIDLDRVCRENNIKYSLCAGTLLGAVRHKGYIPWDDDIDVCFEREEYEKFLKIYPKQKDSKYGFSTALNKTTVTIADIKVSPLNNTIGSDNQEPWISLFIFDSAPNNKVLAKVKAFIIKMLMGMMGKPPQYYSLNKKTKTLFAISSILGLPFTERFKLKLHRQLSTFDNRKDKKYITRYNIFLSNILYARYPKSIFDDYTELPFEGYKFMAMSGYDQFLKLEYGDYMTLPPVEQRVAKHQF